eukprot:g3979.t1
MDLDSWISSSSSSDDEEGPKRASNANQDHAFMKRLVESGKGREWEDAVAARKFYERAIEASPDRVCSEARLRIASLVHADASSIKCLNSVETELRRAIHDAEIEGNTTLRALALDRLCLLLCQFGDSRSAETRRLLQNAGYIYRLSNTVLHYSNEPSNLQTKALQEEDYTRYLRVVDNALPQGLFSKLQTCFASTSPFWSEHRYNSEQTGYFSYLHELKPVLDAVQRPSLSAPPVLIHQVISHVFRLALARFPQLGKARFAEWWAHKRPHCSGHQMHYDSDAEGESAGDGPRHPLVSTVIYLTDEIGGPTLVTTQERRGSEPELLASHGWFSFPKLNRVSMFHGSMLHGVVPGRGIPASSSEKNRRITLMVAFWEDIEFRPRSDESFGASMPFPTSNTSVTWTRPFLDTVEVKDITETTEAIDRIPPLVSPVWQTVHPQNIENDEKENENQLPPVPPVSALRSLPSYKICFQGF